MRSDQRIQNNPLVVFIRWRVFCLKLPRNELWFSSRPFGMKIRYSTLQTKHEANRDDVRVAVDLHAGHLIKIIIEKNVAHVAG